MIQEHPTRGEGHVDFLGESEGSLPPPHDSFQDAGEAIDDFSSMAGNFIFRHHVELRVKLYSLREESFPIPLKYIDVSRTTHTNLDVKHDASMITGISMVQEIFPSKKPKVIYTDNSLECGKSCEDLSWNILRQHHTDRTRMGLLREQCAESRKGHLRCYCSSVWVENVGQSPWNVTAVCETFKMFCLMGRLHMKGGSGCPSTDQ